MLNILVKDLKMLFFSDKGSIGKKVISIVFTVLMLVVFIGIEVFLFSTIIKDVKTFPGASDVYLTLFLFIISCIMIILNTLTAAKLFFNKKDVEQLTRYPVTNSQIILSKLVFMFAMHYATSFMFTYPLFVSYGQILGRAPLYYFITLFYPLLSFLVEGGVAMLLVYPFKLTTDFLKKHVLVQFIVAIVFMFGACYLYSHVLSIFMNLVVNNNINLLFTSETITKLSLLVSKFIPINFLASFFLGQSRKIFLYLCIGLGIFLIGTSVSIFAFNYFRNITIANEVKERKGNIKPLSIKKSLIKKELVLLFKDSNNIFSYAGLLIVQPFLLYLVVTALNNVFSSGTFAYYLIALPYFMPVLDIVLIMLFSVIINSGANNYISNEKHTVRIMKTMPISVFTQLTIKVGVPYILSCISLIFSTTVLFVSKTISLQTYLCSTLLTIVLLAVYELIALKEELSIRFKKPKSTFLSSMYSYLLPLSFLAISLLLSYLGLNIIFAYLISLVFLLILALPFIIKFKQKTISSFLDLEVVN